MAASKRGNGEHLLRFLDFLTLELIDSFPPIAYSEKPIAFFYSSSSTTNNSPRLPICSGRTMLMPNENKCAFS